MQNPIILKENETIIEAGDPYILRFNGKYYLYVSFSINYFTITFATLLLLRTMQIPFSDTA